MYYGKSSSSETSSSSSSSSCLRLAKTRILFKIAIVVTIFSLLCAIYFNSIFINNTSLNSSSQQEEQEFGNFLSFGSPEHNHETQPTPAPTKKPKLNSRLEKQQFKRIIQLEQEIQTLRDQAQTNKIQTLKMLKKS